MYNTLLNQKLERVGLSPKEALIYSHLMDKGGAYPSKIAEEVKLNRSTVYAILVDLSVKGLVNEIEKKNKLFYTVERPDRLLRHAKSRITMANDQYERTEQLLPDLEGLYNMVANKARVRYFEGVDGILTVLEDHILTEKSYEMVAISNANHLEYFLPKEFFEKYRRTKERRGITTRGIIPDTPENRTFNSRVYDGFKKKIIPVMHYVSAEQFPFKGEITIYGDNKVSIVNMSDENITGLIIEDSLIHNMMRMIFELAWNSSKE